MLKYAVYREFSQVWHLLCIDIAGFIPLVYMTCPGFLIVYSIIFFYFPVYKFPFPCYNEAMKVTRNLEISAHEFFETMFLNLAEEIRATDKADVDPADFRTGYTYTHHPENPVLKVSFEIVEYQEDTLYKAVRTSANATTTVCYQVAATETGITVTFFYENSADQKKKKGFFSGFGEIYMLSRMTDALYAIQKDAITRRDGYVERRTQNPLRPVTRKKTSEE